MNRIFLAGALLAATTLSALAQTPTTQTSPRLLIKLGNMGHLACVSGKPTLIVGDIASGQRVPIEPVSSFKSGEVAMLARPYDFGIVWGPKLADAKMKRDSYTAKFSSFPEACT